MLIDLNQVILLDWDIEDVIGGVQMLSLGIICEYIGKVY